MTTNNTAGRGLAIAAGVILATGTLAILFEDVLMHGAAFTLKHWLTLVTVAGTMMVGHLADLARRHGHWLPVAGFTCLFLAGTGIVVYSSVGRQAEKTMISSEEHDKNVGERMKLEAERDTDAASAKKYRAEADTECKSGEGKLCRSARTSRDFYDNSVKGLDARIKILEPAKPVSAEAEQLANVAAALGYDKEKVQALAILLSPFLTTLFLEFGTIVSFGFAFSPKRKVGTVRLDLGTGQTSFASDGSEGRWFAPDPPNGSPNRRGGRYTKDEAASDLVTRLALGERFGSQDELRDRYGVAKLTMSDWLGEWERSGLVSRTQTGRCKALARA